MRTLVHSGLAALKYEFRRRGGTPPTPVLHMPLSRPNLADGKGIT